MECSVYDDYYEESYEFTLETYVWCSEVDIEKEVEDIIDDVEKELNDWDEVKIKEEWEESRYDNADDCKDEADDAEEGWWS